MKSKEATNRISLTIILNIVLIITLIILYNMYHMAVQEAEEKDLTLEEIKSQLSNIYDVGLDVNEELAYIKKLLGNIEEAYDSSATNIESFRDGYTDWRQIAENLESIYPQMGSDIGDINNGIYRIGECISKVIDYTRTKTKQY
ncbi:MAG: hypothetical protein ACOX3L_02330 [Lutisporaceae bacterium]|jgi:hypothetical protein